MKHKLQALDKRIGLMVFPYGEKYQGLMLRFIDFLAPMVKELSLVTGNFRTNLPYDNVNIINVRTPTLKDTKEPVVSKIFRLLLVQFTFSRAVIHQSKKSDVIMLYLSTGLLLLPVLWARILNKKVVVIATGSISQSLRAMYPSLSERIYSVIIGWIERFDYSLANRIVVCSNSTIADMRLEKHRNKISVAPEHFLDFDKFKVQKGLSERHNLVGYVARLSESICKLINDRNLRILLGKNARRFLERNYNCDEVIIQW